MDLLNFEARAALLERVASTASRLLVVTEGLLVYFSPEQVARLATDLAIRQAFGWWITDIVSPTLLKMLVKSRGAANETGVQPTFFGPADGTAFFRPFGWRQSVYRSSIEDAVRLGRAPRSVRIALRVSRFVPGGDRLSRLSAHVLLERAT
jgi:O-methyltransferase involved in polyketide biosynthesis